jgi:bifunctional non-homologous end joining protein LigD
VRAAKSAAGSNLKLPVVVSNPDKIFWPDENYTKLDLINFYAAIFPSLEPYVKDRMLTLERCPDGMKGECFYQKEIPRGMPPGTPTKRIQNVEGKRRFTNYVVGGSLQTQLALANLGCIAVHVMGSRASSPRQPDWVCFDLDPESGKFADAAQAGLYVKRSAGHAKARIVRKDFGQPRHACAGANSNRAGC